MKNNYLYDDKFPKRYIIRKLTSHIWDNLQMIHVLMEEWKDKFYELDYDEYIELKIQMIDMQEDIEIIRENIIKLFELNED